jgi:hypothetical protein
LRFWKNAIRWLMKDSTVSRVTVDTPRENYAVGDEVRVIVRVRDPGFAPLEGAEVEVGVASPGQNETVRGVSSADGELVLVLPAERRGTHRITVRASTSQGAVGDASTVFAVTTRDPELDEVSPDVAFLEWMAASTGGTFYAHGDLGPPQIDASSGRVVWERTETVLWRAPLAALWVLFFAGIAWVVRRRAGLR